MVDSPLGVSKEYDFCYYQTREGKTLQVVWFETEMYVVTWVDGKVETLEGFVYD